MLSIEIVAVLAVAYGLLVYAAVRSQLAVRHTEAQQEAGEGASAAAETAR